MQEAHGGIQERDILHMPYRRFVAYCQAIPRMYRRQQMREFFGGQTLEEEWLEQGQGWLALQPPPPEVMHHGGAGRS